jgi:hypothetical protein
MSGRDRNAPRRATADISDISVNGEVMSADARAVLYHLKYASPFLLLLLLRFLFTYVVRIIFLVTLFGVQYRICESFNEQIALKGSSSKKAFWFLFWSGLGTLILVSILAPPTFKTVLWPRFAFLPFDNPDIDFLGVLWITCLADMVFRVGLTVVKSFACALLPTYSTQPDSYNICSGDISLSSLLRIGPGLRIWYLNLQRSG